MEQTLKKQIADANGCRAQEREALPVKDQRAHLLGQARSLADKMDQQKEAVLKEGTCGKNR
eukprot:2802616-Amphidinium_carterae.1